MTLRRTLVLAVLVSLAPTAMVMAQTEPQTDTTSPAAASSPHQRDTTQMTTPESSTTGQSSSSSSSGKTHTASAKQSMKSCIAKQQSDNQGMSSADARKACKAQMKGPG